MSTPAIAAPTAPAAAAPAATPAVAPAGQPAVAPVEAPAEARVLKPIPPAPAPSRDAAGKFKPAAMPGEPGFTAPGAAKLPWDDSADGGDEPIATLPGQLSEEPRRKKVAAPIATPGAEQLEPAPVDAPEPVPAAKFLLGDVEFPSQEAAVQAFKTMQGQLKPTMRMNEQLKQSARQNAEAAAAWKARAEALEQGSLQGREANTGAVPSGTATGVAAPSSAGTGTAASAGQAAVAQGAEQLGLSERLVREAIDWPHFKTTYDEHGPDVAMFMALEGLTAKLLAQSDSRFDALQAPSKAEAHARSVGESINGIIFGTAERLGLAEATRDDGTLLYPALSDDSAVGEIAQLIVRMHRDDGWSEAQINSPKGVHHAYLLWKDWRERTGRPWQPVAQAPAPASLAPPEQQRHSPLAPGQSMPPRPSPASAARGERIRRTLREVAAPNELGYSE